MTDTNHIEVLREIRRVYIDPETIAALDAAITALSAHASAGEGGVDEHVRLLVGKLDQWRMCMSHNESYFGEPAGLVKATIAELAKAVDPIYPPKPEPVDPLAGVAIYTATVPHAATPQPAQADEVEGADMREFERRNAAFVNALPRKIDGSNSQPAQAGASGGGVPFGWAKAGPNGMPMLHTATYNREKCDEWAVNGWNVVPLYTAPASPATGHEYRHSTHHVHRGPESLPCYCAATMDHSIGQEAATPQPESARGEWARLRELSEAASENWTMGRNGFLNGVLLGGAVQQFVRGSGQTQIAMFTSPNYNGEIDRDPAAEQRANTEFALACVTYVRAMLAAAPQPQQAPAQADDAAEQYRQAHNAGEAHGRVMAALEAATPPAHGDGEGVAELLAKLPSLETLDAVDDDLRRGTRPCPLNNLTINDVKLLHRVLTTRPTPEAQDAARYRWLRENADIEDVFYGDRVKLAIPAPDIDGFNDLNEIIDAALALPAQGEGNNG